MSQRRIVIGIGNPDRGDDGVGPLVVDKLRDLLPPGVDAIVHSGEATSLLAKIEGASAAFLVDASWSGARVGTIRRIDVNRDDLPDLEMKMSTHGFGLAGAVELGRVLDQLPLVCVVYVIEAQNMDTGAPLSPQVVGAAEAVAGMIRDEVMQDA
ncbi:hydrogenase maturation protease [Bauldia sp.]|uniref:hydrogenase maturation protease n=1 Tax=Bauldia sp. TaxID=2575872 RepID=UPI003BA9CF5C